MLSRGPRAFQHHPSSGHFVLHVHADQLPRGCIPGSQHPLSIFRLHPLCRPVPPSHCGAHRRHWEIMPQFVGRELRASRDDFGVGITLFLLGLFKKYVADNAALLCRCRLQRGGPARGAVNLRRLDRHGRFCAPDYIRFLRLFGHGHRPGPDVRDHFPVQFDSLLTAPPPSSFSGSGGTARLTAFCANMSISVWAGTAGGISSVNHIMATMLLSGLWQRSGLDLHPLGRSARDFYHHPTTSGASGSSGWPGTLTTGFSVVPASHSRSS